MRATHRVRAASAIALIVAVLAAAPAAWADDSIDGTDSSTDSGTSAEADDQGGGLLGDLLGGGDASEDASDADEAESASESEDDWGDDSGSAEEAAEEPAEDAAEELAEEVEEPAEESTEDLLGDLLGGDPEESEEAGDLLGDLLGGGAGDLEDAEAAGDLLGDLLGGDLLGGDLLGGDLLGGGTGSDSLESPWGTVIPGSPGPQSHAWLLRVDGLLDKSIFASHYPVMPGAPKVRSGGSELIRLTAPAKVPLLPAVGLGVASGVYTKAIGNAVSGNPGQMDLPYPGAAHAEAAAASIDVGVPYISNIIPGGKQLSLVGVHLEGVRVQVTSWRQRLMFSGMGPVAGYVSMLGNPLLEIPADGIQPNLGIRLPEDRSAPALAEVVLNEQVTTDSEGLPTEDKNGRYFFDPKATSGYANAAHISVLGLNVLDVTVGHAAVITKPRPKK